MTVGRLVKFYVYSSLQWGRQKCAAHACQRIVIVPRWIDRFLALPNRRTAGGGDLRSDESLDPRRSRRSQNGTVDSYGRLGKAKPGLLL